MANTLLLPHTVRSLNLSPKEQAAIACLYTQTTSSSDAQDGHFINIHSDEWQGLLGYRDYKLVLESLAHRGIIEINNRYSVGNWPKSYRLTDPHRVPQFIETPAPPRMKPQSRINLAPDDAVCWKLVECFQKVKLPDCKFHGWDELAVRRIHNREFYATRCRYGRFHHSFTGLNKAARRMLTTPAGEPLFEIDVSCCQPLMVPTLMRTSGYSGTRGLDKFIALCQSGTLYDYLAEACRIAGLNLGDCYAPGTWKPHWKAADVQRNHAKKAFITLLFCDCDMMQNHPLFGVVQVLFPAVAQFIRDIKAKCYQQLARDCQVAESTLMINQVCGHLMEQCPDITLITIHDSILTTAAHAKRVAGAMQHAFLGVGISPTLKENDAVVSLVA